MADVGTATDEKGDNRDSVADIEQDDAGCDHTIEDGQDRVS
jgi:hypothetical protein